MSYECEICFKKLAPEDVYDFLLEFKHKATECRKEIAKENCCYMPTIRRHLEPPEIPKTIFDADIPEDLNWALNSIFKHRYFYDKELNLLGVYSVHKCLWDLFDGHVFFQNNCDQDYEKSDYNGIKDFENIYDKYDKYSVEQILEEFPKQHWNLDEEDNLAENEEQLGYCRRTLAYDEIWRRFEKTLNEESSVVYFSIYGPYENWTILEFILECYEQYKIKYESWK